MVREPTPVEPTCFQQEQQRASSSEQKSEVKCRPWVPPGQPEARRRTRLARVQGMHGLEPAPCIAHSRSLMAKSTRASPTEPPLLPTRTRAWPRQAPQLSPLRLSCMLRRARPPGERTWQALCSEKVHREYGIVCHDRASAALSCPLCALPVTWSADRGDRNRETAIQFVINKKNKDVFCILVWGVVSGHGG